MQELKDRLQSQYRKRYASYINPWSILNHTCSTSDIPILYLTEKQQTSLIQKYRLRVERFPDYKFICLPSGKHFRKHSRFKVITQLSSLSLEEQLKLIPTNNQCDLLYFECKQYLGEHICIREWCDMHEHRYEKGHIPTFICKKSGNIHFCGPFCDNGQEECQLSGMTISPIFSGDITIDHSRSQNNFAYSKRKRHNCSDVKFNSESILVSPTPEPDANRSSLDSLEDYINYATRAILAILSDKRYNDDKMSNLSKREQKYYKLHKDVQHCLETSDHIRLVDIISMSDAIDDKFIYHVSPQLEKEDKLMIAEIYARKCVNLWYIIITQTPIGKANRKLFHFIYFIYPALSIFINGFLYHDNGQMKYLYEPSSDLQHLIVGWNISSYTYTSSNNKNSKSVQNVDRCMKAALNDALTKVSPQVLKLENVISYDLSLFNIPRRTKKLKCP